MRIDKILLLEGTDMNTCTFLWGLFCVIGISIGQILFKLASRNLILKNNMNMISDLMHNYYLIIGLIFYGVITIFWVGLLRLVDLRYAYPLMALAFLFVPILAKIFLGEDLKLNTIIGGIIIIAGVYVSVRC